MIITLHVYYVSLYISTYIRYKYRPFEDVLALGNLQMWYLGPRGPAPWPRLYTVPSRSTCGCAVWVKTEMCRVRSTYEI